MTQTKLHHRKRRQTVAVCRSYYTDERIAIARRLHRQIIIIADLRLRSTTNTVQHYTASTTSELLDCEVHIVHVGV